MNGTWRRVALLLAFLSVGASPIPGPGLNSVMRDKLVHSQKILEAMVTSNWTTLDVEARALDRLTNEASWTVLQTAEYAQRSQAFKRAIQDLREAAADRDLDRAPTAYNTLTQRCIDCHRYMARSRIASRR